MANLYTSGDRVEVRRGRRWWPATIIHDSGTGCGWQRCSWGADCVEVHLDSDGRLRSNASRDDIRPLVPAPLDVAPDAHLDDLGN